MLPWRRLAMSLAQHASWVLPGAGPWAEAMRHELDYIEDDFAALRWATGGLLASYRVRLGEWSARASFRYVGLSGILMLAIGFALMGEASGQPLRPAFNEAACDRPDVSPQVAPRLCCRTVGVARDYENPAGAGFKLAVKPTRPLDT
jgi:hypothetical protein